MHEGNTLGGSTPLSRPPSPDGRKEMEGGWESCSSCPYGTCHMEEDNCINRWGSMAKVWRENRMGRQIKMTVQNGKEEEEKCFTLYLAVSVLLRIMSVILTVSRLNYSPPDVRFTSLPWSQFRAHKWWRSNVAEIYFLTRAHNNINVFPPFLPLYSKSKLRFFLDWRWVACVRSSESTVLHMALTVRAPSPQTQLRAPDGCYASFPIPWL